MFKLDVELELFKIDLLFPLDNVNLKMSSKIFKKDILKFVDDRIEKKFYQNLICMKI